MFLSITANIVTTINIYSLLAYIQLRKVRFCMGTSAWKKEKAKLEYVEALSTRLLLRLQKLDFDVNYLIQSQISFTGKWAT